MGSRLSSLVPNLRVGPSKGSQNEGEGLSAEDEEEVVIQHVTVTISISDDQHLVHELHDGHQDGCIYVWTVSAGY